MKKLFIIVGFLLITSQVEAFSCTSTLTPDAVFVNQTTQMDFTISASGGMQKVGIGIVPAYNISTYSLSPPNTYYSNVNGFHWFYYPTTQYNAITGNFDFLPTQVTDYDIYIYASDVYDQNTWTNCGIYEVPAVNSVLPTPRPTATPTPIPQNNPAVGLETRSTDLCGYLNNYAGCQNAKTVNTSYAYGQGSAGALYLYGFGFTIPNTATIEGFTFNIKGNASGSGGTPNIRNWIVGLYNEGEANKYGSISSGDCASRATITPAETDNTFEATLPASCWASYSFTPDEINSGYFGIKINNSTNGSADYFIDLYSLTVNYSYPGTGYTFNIDSSEASPSGQYISMDLSGSTASVSADMFCHLKLYEDCTSNEERYQSYPNSIANVFLQATNTDNFTTKVGENSWLGHDWGAGDNTWLAEGVRVPYNYGYYCSYPVEYQCSTPDKYIGGSGFMIDGQLIDTPDAQAEGILIDPEPSDPLQWVVWKIKKTLVEIFGVDTYFSDIYINRIKDDLALRRPFIYTNAIATWNLENPYATYSGTQYIPPFHIEWNPTLITNGQAQAISPVVIDIPSSTWDPVKESISQMRQIIGYAINLFFLIYLIKYAQRLVKK